MSEGKAVEGSAPGRLDVLGGVSDYSGGLVLQMPTQARTTVHLETSDSDRLSFDAPAHRAVELSLQDFLSLLDVHHDETKVVAWMDESSIPTWTRYLIGCLLYFCAASKWRPEGGLTFRVTSDVPASLGISSSAALEIASMRAMEALTQIHLSGTDIAHLAQQAENRIVKAPCGIMDQLASAFGSAGNLLPILCQPDLLRDPIPLPEGVHFVGWPSGVRRAVSASPYTRARAATFMGKKMFEVRTGRSFLYAADISPSLFHRYGELAVAPSVSGQEFLNHYEAVDDNLCEIFPDIGYPVHAALRFPIEETFRAELVESLLRHFDTSRKSSILNQVGQLMLLSHCAYNAMGLGCPETDKMVDEAMKIGPEGGVYGARISGGGAGGTVVVLCTEEGLPRLEKLAATLIFNPDLPAKLIR